MTKRTKISLIILIPIILIRLLLGVFVIPPSGVTPDGATVIYFRAGSKMSFITSVDGIQVDLGRDISIFTRMIVSTKIIPQIQKRKIISLPYSERLYLISTGGKK